MRVGMIGPGLDVPGGMTQVHRTWLQADAIKGVQVDYIETMSERPPLRWLAKNLACEARYAAKLVTGYRPDLVHVHVADGTSFWRKLAYIEQARLAGIPAVAHLHGAWMEDFYDRSPGNRAAVRRMLSSVDLVLPLHHRMADCVRRWGPPGLRVEVLYNPVIVSDFAASPAAPPAASPAASPAVSPAAAATVLMMGVLDERKGPFDLAQAMPAVLAAAPDTRFVFGGNGDLARMERLCRDLGVWQQVHLLGWIQGPQKLKAFAEASIYCLPSHFENLPVSIIEAMAAGLPVVATDIAGVPEEVIEGQTGFLVPPRDPAALAAALIRLLEDPQLAHRLGAAGRARAEQYFDNEVVVTRLVELWRSVARPRSTTAPP